MKNLIFFFAVGFVFNTSNAHQKHHGSDLNLKLYDNGIFTVMLDNKSINVPSNNFSFNNLMPGNHHLKVIKHYPAFWGNCSPAQLIFNGFVQIPPKSKIYAMIDLYNQYEVYSIFPAQFEPVCSTGNFYDNDEIHCGNSLPLNPVYMNSNIFNKLKYSVMNATFESDKLKIAKQGIFAHGVSSQQVLELIELFSFETNKIKLAKFAYQYTFDKPNYFLVNNGFTFSSSINELNKFISMY